MNLSEQEYNLIHKYLSESLNSESDKAAFQNALANEEFRTALLEQAKLVDSLEVIDNEDTRSLLESFEQSNNLDAKSPKKNVPPKKEGALFTWLKYLVILAMLLGLAYAGYNAGKDKTDYPHILAYYGSSTFPPEVMDRSMASKISPLYKKTMGAYARKDFNLAVEGLTQLESDEQIKMYLGNSYLQLKEYNKALPLFDELCQSGNKKIRQNAEWYKALSLLGLKRKKEAIKTLNFVKKQDYHLFDRKAGKLLKEIK